MDSDGDVHVKFEKMNQMWCLNPTFVKKLTRFSVNQMVRVRDDMCTLNAIRTQFGSDGYSVANAVRFNFNRTSMNKQSKLIFPLRLLVKLGVLQK